MTTALHKVKLAPVTADTKVISGAEGIVQAIVNVTGNLDSDGDVVVPGAHDLGIGRVTPKGVWHHDWTTPIAKTLADQEVFPGDASLDVDLLADGLGGRRVRMLFNMDDDEAVKSFSRVAFYGPEQEWSVGYDVRGQALGSEMSLSLLTHPKAQEWWNTVGALMAAEMPGANFIFDWDVYEYSPVLFGSNRMARTEGMKGHGARALEDGARIGALEKEVERLVVTLGSKGLGIDPPPTITKDLTIEHALLDMEQSVAWLYGEGVKNLKGDYADRVQNIVTALAVLAVGDDDEDDEGAGTDDAGDAGEHGGDGGDEDADGSGDGEGEGAGDTDEGADTDDGGTGEGEGDATAPQALDEADVMEFEMIRLQVGADT